MKMIAPIENGVKVVYRTDTESVVFDVGDVALKEIKKFIERLWPWELGRHVVEEGGALVFKERIPFDRALAYILARSGGLNKRESEFFASALRLHELMIFSDAFLYRLELCQIEFGDCGHVIKAFAKIAKTYRDVLP
ncbi:MAG: hypothetical protein QW085_07110 [Pyrobaculum sp.]